MAERIGIIAGSFDPVTNGHVWLIEQALGLVDRLHVVVATNPAKKHMFSAYQRWLGVTNAIDILPYDLKRRIVISALTDQLVVDFAVDVGATLIIRGIRDVTDFSYETNMMTINQALNPSIQTVFLIQPHGVSSSMVRSLVGTIGWEERVKMFVCPMVAHMLSDAYEEAKRGKA